MHADKRILHNYNKQCINLNSEEKKIYTILIIAFLIGFFWIGYNLTTIHELKANHIEVCFIKKATNLPCPSCGATRSVISLLNGEFSKAIYTNPLGFIIIIIITILPFWIIIDLIIKKKTLFKSYKKIEALLKNKIVFIPLIILLLTNWIWNIIKRL